METYVNDNKVTIGSEYDYDDVVMEIAGLLAVGPRDDGMYRLADVCQSDNINIWAKFKPFQNHNPFFSSESAYEQARLSANYGVATRKTTSIKTLMGYCKGNLNGWALALPNGTSRQWNRLLDFEGYNHNCKSPFTRFSSWPKANVNTYPTSGFTISLLQGGGQGIEGNLKMGDFKDIMNGYVTIQLRHKNPSGTGVYIRTISAEKTVAEMDGGSITFSTYQLPAGTWDIVPFISPVKYDGNDGNELPSSQQYVTIPYCTLGEMKISDTEFALIYFQAYKNPYLIANPVYSISYNFAVQNNGPDRHTFSNVIVQIRYPNKSFDSVLDAAERQITIPAFTVESGEAKSVAEVLTGGTISTWTSQEIGKALYDNAGGQEILVRLDNGQPVHRLTIKTSSTDAPEYDPSIDYPTIITNE